MAMHPI